MWQYMLFDVNQNHINWLGIGLTFQHTAAVNLLTVSLLISHMRIFSIGVLFSQIMEETGTVQVPNIMNVPFVQDRIFLLERKTYLVLVACQ